MQTIKCLLCLQTGPAELVSSTLRDDSSRKFRVFRCLTCGHLQLFPLPLPAEDIAFNQADQQTLNLMLETDLHLWQRKTKIDTDRRVRWVMSLSDETIKVLDVGCGYGFFVESLVSQGYAATGLDVSTNRLTIARRLRQGKFIEGSLDEAFVNRHHSQFDCVTLFHVLEHVLDPVECLHMCGKLVAPGGCILIEVPNAADTLLDFNDGYRNFYWQRAHLSYFDPARLELALRRANLYKFKISGVQRYGLRNLLHWIDQGGPQIDAPDYYADHPMLIALEELYRRDRECSLSSDTLICTVHIP